MEFYTYVCDICKKTSRISKDDAIPQCCGKLMTRLNPNENKSGNLSDK
ncbi:MAG: hypothetical protein KBH06_02450 [Spirochaetes bacterium]|nr:hypothetical protein [Spirochaetota bacterium]